MCCLSYTVNTMHLDALTTLGARASADMVSDTAKLTTPPTLADKRWVGPVKLLCIIMFDISKIRPKCIHGPVKAQKFSQCLWFWHQKPEYSVYSTRRVNLSVIIVLTIWMTIKLCKTAVTPLLMHQTTDMTLDRKAVVFHGGKWHIAR